VLRPVLVVEDDRKIARVVALYLEEAGYRVVQAATGRKALEEAGRERPLLVVLDLMLPDIGGEQVIQELKALGDVPVIMLTSRSSEEDRVVGFALGADDYVVKPFSPRELVSRVKAVLKRARRDDLSESGPVSFERGLLILDGHRYGPVPWRAAVLTPAGFKCSSHSPPVGPRDDAERSSDKASATSSKGTASIDAHVKNIRQKLGDGPGSRVRPHRLRPRLQVHREARCVAASGPSSSRSSSPSWRWRCPLRSCCAA
jgi:two-component system OmpR family response regulator